MAGSRSSPLLRDQWSAADDTRDQRDSRDRGRPRPRGSERGRGRDKFRDRERRRRSKANEPRPPLRSPPPSRSHPRPDFEGNRSHREFSPNNPSARGSPGHPYTEPRQRQREPYHDSSRPAEYPDSGLPVERATERDYKRDGSPSAPPPFKRKRTQSPPPGLGPHSRQYNQSYNHPLTDQFDEADRGYPHKKRGRFPGRGRARRRSPRRGRDRRRKEFDRFNPSEPNSYRNPRDRFPSPRPEDGPEDEFRHRSTSRHSFQSRASRFSANSRRNSNASTAMNPRPVHTAMDNSFGSPSPPRPHSNFDPGPASAPIDGDTNSYQRAHASRSHLDTSQHSTSPNYVIPNNSRSPQSTSPHPGRGGWASQAAYSGPQGSRHSSPYRQNNYPSQSGSQDQFHQGQSPPTGPSNHGQSYSGPSYRGGHSGYRGNYQNHGQNRRFSGSGPSPRGRGRFNNFQWSARGRGGSNSPHTTHGHPSQSPPPLGDTQSLTGEREEQETFASSRRDFQGKDRNSIPGSENGDSEQVPRPAQPSETSSTPNKGGKFSFAFKAKSTPAPAPKPVPDLAQRMQAREPPPRVADAPLNPRNRVPLGPPPRFKPEPRFDRRDRDRDRDRQRNRDRDRGRHDRRDFRDSRDVRDYRDDRDIRKDDHRIDHRHGPRNDERLQDARPPRGPRRARERSPNFKPPKTLTRPKPRPILPEEYAKSDSVYYRKPGNESVIGAGTYGKVFKAIHVYTQKKVALKKIRMEGEKDGFPVTAVREIKLLQHLRNHNVVSLLEVMVERNECFMVFEYLSHDLTGLINHPTFNLTAAHKKNLAKQMFEGLNYLHHRSVLHRDIKAANILISNTGLLKFADFGLARFFSKSRQLDYTNRVITIWYRPPELLLGETRYGPAVDVWSAGCVFVELFTKKAVFPGEGGEISQLEKLYNSLGTPTRAEWADIVEMPWFELMRPTERKKRVFEDVYRTILSPAALDLISQIFRYDPAKRPTAEEVLTHPYFTSEEPAPQQAVELENIEGDWHEFESKALRKEKDKEARRAEYLRDKEKRKAALSAPQSDRDPKRAKQDTDENPQSSE